VNNTQNECSGHACIPIAELQQQVRKLKRGHNPARRQACLGYYRVVAGDAIVILAVLGIFEQRTMAVCYWQFHKNEFLEVTVNE